ncbi:MAG TPA: hypothetical protein VFJ58_02715 [Armatimonadota bacterium]|nr:hypothetical protein [Armatimonadota bacterium]
MFCDHHQGRPAARVQNPGTTDGEKLPGVEAHQLSRSITSRLYLSSLDRVPAVAVIAEGTAGRSR